MAGLIAALFGGRSRPPDPDPLPGQGGYAMPPGRDGAGGFPGSTSLTRTFGMGTSPRVAKIRSDRFGGITPVTQARAEMQDVAGEFYGGPLLKTEPPLNDTAGGNPLSEAAAAGGHSVRDTETPVIDRQFQIARDVPGAANVRNQVAERYKAVPGQVRAYQSAPRGDLPGSSTSRAEAVPVMVPSRFVFEGGGVQTWGMLRQMPYTGRGDGARGADLNGQRYYATGGYGNFVNAGAGQYGAARLAGRKRPVSFAEPAPWTANFYDTTAGVGTSSSPGTPAQAPDMVYVSPQAPRAGNGTGRG